MLLKFFQARKQLEMTNKFIKLENDSELPIIIRTFAQWRIIFRFSKSN